MEPIMETKIIWVPQDILLMGYHSTLLKLTEQKQQSFRSGIPTPHKWMEEDESYFSEMSDHFYLIRTSKEERLELKVNIKQGGIDNV